MSDIDTAGVDSLKAFDPKRPIREADIPRAGTNSAQYIPKSKSKNANIQVSGRRHAESSVEWMDPVTHPKCNPRHDEYDDNCRNCPHLLSREVYAERKRSD